MFSNATGVIITTMKLKIQLADVEIPFAGARILSGTISAGYSQVIPSQPTRGIVRKSIGRWGQSTHLRSRYWKGTRRSSRQYLTYCCRWSRSPPEQSCKQPAQQRRIAWAFVFQPFQLWKRRSRMLKSILYRCTQQWVWRGKRWDRLHFVGRWECSMSGEGLVNVVWKLARNAIAEPRVNYGWTRLTIRLIPEICWKTWLTYARTTRWKCRFSSMVNRSLNEPLEASKTVSLMAANSSFT